MRNTWWKSGQFNALCDVCGKKFKSVELKQRWDGLMVCQVDWETRHPQELIRPVQDQNKLPWTRPEPPDQFISVTYSFVPEPRVEIPTIVLDTSSTTITNLQDVQGTLPVGPHIVNVIVPAGVSLVGITTGSGWAAGTIFNITNNSIYPFHVFDPTNTYIINEFGIDFGEVIVYITGPVGAANVLSYAVAQWPTLQPAVFDNNWRIVVTGSVDSLDFSGFPVGCTFNLDTQGTVSKFYTDVTTDLYLVDTQLYAISGYDLILTEGIWNNKTVMNDGQIHTG